MTAYAEGTAVPVDRTIAAVQAEVVKRGGTDFGYLASADRDLVVFRLQGRSVRMGVSVPQWRDYRNNPRGPGYAYLSEKRARELAVQEHRRRWWALLLVIKSLLVAVDDGIVTMADAFLAYTVLPGGATVGDTLTAQLEAAGYDAPALALTAAGAP